LPFIFLNFICQFDTSSKNKFFNFLSKLVSIEKPFYKYKSNDPTVVTIDYGAS